VLCRPVIGVVVVLCISYYASYRRYFPALFSLLLKAFTHSFSILSFFSLSCMQAHFPVLIFSILSLSFFLTLGQDIFFGFCFSSPSRSTHCSDYYLLLSLLLGGERRYLIV